jgi:hypothetical protein
LMLIKAKSLHISYDIGVIGALNMCSQIQTGSGE